MDNGAHPTFADAQAILPAGVVFLSVNPNTKAPFRDSWQLITYADTQGADYQNELATAETIGVLLGPPSCSLIVIDCDTGNFFREMILLNCEQNETLISKGARGGALWYLIEGDYPAQVYKLWVPKGSRLGIGGKPNSKDPDFIAVGEFRGGKCQSIICWRHPSGCSYCWPCVRPPNLRKLSDIIFPPEPELRWKDKPPKPPPPKQTSEGFNQTEHCDLLQEALARLSIDMLWDHLNYGPRRGNPTHSPFREDKAKRRLRHGKSAMASVDRRATPTICATAVAAAASGRQCPPRRGSERQRGRPSHDQRRREPSPCSQTGKYSGPRSSCCSKRSTPARRESSVMPQVPTEWSRPSAYRRARQQARAASQSLAAGASRPFVAAR